LLLGGSGAAARSGGEPRPLAAIKTIVLHASGGPTCRADRVIWIKAGGLRATRRYLEQHRVLGIHYLVGRDGEVLTSVPIEQVAHHTRGHNRDSVGIELINHGDGHDPYPEAQLAALAALLADLTRRLGLSPSAVTAHSELDTSLLPCDPRQKRKPDPGGNFPLQQLRARLHAGRRSGLAAPLRTGYRSGRKRCLFR
jgi:N-acetyl-anhydromuramyl-L-alanine amidase AmpD